MASLFVQFINVQFCKKGCRKHVFNKYGWYYYFDEKASLNKVFPSQNTRENT